MNKKIKDYIRRCIESTGYQFTKQKLVQFDSHYLSQISEPSTVIDVGVGFGTPELYKSYPNAYFYLIEPLDVFSEHLKEITKNVKGEVLYYALGSKPGTATINVDLSDKNKATIFDRTPLTQSKNPSKKSVKVTTLFELFNNGSKLSKPILLKIDSEGCELDILQGAGPFLTQVETLICEASIADRFNDGYTFNQLISYLYDNGFELYSIVNISQPIAELRPRFADLVFKRRDSL